MGLLLRVPSAYLEISCRFSCKRFYLTHRFTFMSKKAAGHACFMTNLYMNFNKESYLFNFLFHIFLFILFYLTFIITIIIIIIFIIIIIIIT